MVGTVTGKNIINRTLDVPEGDYIESIQACYSDKKVVYLMFTTYRGTKAAFGYQRGDLVAVGNPGYTFGPAKGGYQKERLNYIVFPAATIPENISGSGYNTMAGQQIPRSVSPNMMRAMSPAGNRPVSPNSMSRTTMT